MLVKLYGAREPLPTPHTPPPPLRWRDFFNKKKRDAHKLATFFASGGLENLPLLEHEEKRRRKLLIREGFVFYCRQNSASQHNAELVAEGGISGLSVLLQEVEISEELVETLEKFAREVVRINARRPPARIVRTSTGEDMLALPPLALAFTNYQFHLSEQILDKYKHVFVNLRLIDF